MMPIEKPIRSRYLNIAKGIIAILIWICCYFFVEWYQSVGFLGYLKIALPVAAFLSLVALLSGKARRFLADRVPNAMEWMFDTYEEKMSWVAYFLIALMYVAIIYFVLAAPYGILCHLGLKACGK
jgi:hypothetical protein